MYEEIGANFRGEGEGGEGSCEDTLHRKHFNRKFLMIWIWIWIMCNTSYSISVMVQDMHMIAL